MKATVVIAAIVIGILLLRILKPDAEALARRDETMKTYSELSKRFDDQRDGIRSLEWDVRLLESEVDWLTNDVGSMRGRDLHVETFIYRMVHDDEKRGVFIPPTKTGAIFPGDMPKLGSLTDQEIVQLFGAGLTQRKVVEAERHAYSVALDKITKWFADPANAKIDEVKAETYLLSIENREGGSP